VARQASACCATRKGETASSHRHLCSGRLPVRHPGNALVLRITLGRIGRHKTAGKTHDAVGGGTAAATADGNASGVKAVGQTLRQRGNEKLADADRRNGIKIQWNTAIAGQWAQKEKGMSHARSPRRLATRTHWCAENAALSPTCSGGEETEGKPRKTRCSVTKTEQHRNSRDTGQDWRLRCEKPLNPGVNRWLSHWGEANEVGIAIDRFYHMPQNCAHSVSG